MRELIEEIAFQARECEYVDQNSGVSARLRDRAHRERGLERRAARGHPGRDDRAWPGCADLYAAAPAVTGKVELVYEGEQEGAREGGAAHSPGKALKGLRAHFPDAYKAKPRSGSRRRGAQSIAAAGADDRRLVALSRGGRLVRQREHARDRDEVADAEYRQAPATR